MESEDFVHHDFTEDFLDGCNRFTVQYDPEKGKKTADANSGRVKTVCSYWKNGEFERYMKLRTDILNFQLRMPSITNGRFPPVTINGKKFDLCQIDIDKNQLVKNSEAFCDEVAIALSSNEEVVVEISDSTVAAFFCTLDTSLNVIELSREFLHEQLPLYISRFYGISITVGAIDVTFPSDLNPYAGLTAKIKMKAQGIHKV